MFLLRRFFVKPVVAWSLLNLSLYVMGLSMTDPNFSLIVTKPDNVPIVGLVFLLGFFTWLGAHRAVQNDDRIAQGLEPLEALDKDRDFLKAGGVFTDDFIDGYIALKMQEVTRFRAATHPLEYQMYYTI